LLEKIDKQSNEIKREDRENFHCLKLYWHLKYIQE